MIIVEDPSPVPRSLFPTPTSFRLLKHRSGEGEVGPGQAGQYLSDSKVSTSEQGCQIYRPFVS